MEVPVKTVVLVRLVAVREVEFEAGIPVSVVEVRAVVGSSKVLVVVGGITGGVASR